MKGQTGSSALALTMCVADEAETLAAHLAYHRHQGVARAYIYIDQCTDATAEILARYDWVEAIDFPHPADCPGLPDHQVRAASDALERARRDGMSWLMHIDPDEYAWADPDSTLKAAPQALATMLDSLPADIELVHLAPREVLPERSLTPRPFWNQCYFQAPGQLVDRDILNPMTGQMQRLNKWVGHNIGKSIVRASVDVEPLYAHSWRRVGGGALKTVARGFHYHFVFMGASLWRQKYRKLSWEPDTWITGGKVPFPKQAWKDATSAMSAAEAEAYYERWVALDAAELDRLARAGRITKDFRLRESLSAILSE